MYLTKNQRELIDSRGMVHVSFQPILEKEGTIGYAFKDKFYYKIRLEESIEDNESISMSTLIHELGHIELGHMDESIKESIKYVFKVAEELGISKDTIRLLNRGPMGIINICMDLEVNDKFLTRQNIRDMTNAGYQPVTIEVLGLEPQDYWKDYIRPYLEKTKSDYDNLKDAIDNLFQNLKDIGEMQTKRMKGRGSKMNSGSNGSDESDSDSEKSLGKMISDKEEENEGDKSDSESKSKSDSKDSNEEDGNPDEEIKDEVTQSDMEDDGEDPEEYIEDENELSELITTSDQEYDQNTSYGLSHVNHKSRARVSQKSPSKILEDFFMQLLYHEKTMVVDSMKHYNRGTRRNDHGLVYSSISRKVRLKPRKLGVLIDVSGSMNSRDLLTALDSLEPLLHMLHKDSIVVAWDTKLCGEYSITKLPNSLEECGGTDMASGLRYLNDKGFDTVVIYSDFETDLNTLHNEAERFGKDLSFIVVNSYMDKDNIIKDQNRLVRRVLQFNS